MPQNGWYFLPPTATAPPYQDPLSKPPQYSTTDSNPPPTYEEISGCSAPTNTMLCQPGTSTPAPPYSPHGRNGQKLWWLSNIHLCILLLLSVCPIRCWYKICIDSIVLTELLSLQFFFTGNWMLCFNDKATKFMALIMQIFFYRGGCLQVRI